MVEPTGYTALDLVGFTDRGVYDGNATYVRNDLVHYGGNIWRVLQDDLTATIPSEGVNYTLYIGEPTNLVERIVAPLENNPAESAWTVGRQFIYNDLLYEVIDAIAIGDSLVTYENDPLTANIKLALPVETQLLALKALDDAIINVVAPTESSPSAAAHAVGEQIFYNNTLYTVTTAIAIGDTLTVGTNIAASDSLTEQIDGKQDALTFDNAPTQNSSNPVTSGGVYTALGGKQDTLTFDSTPTSGSTNPVTSGGLYTALDGKQNSLTFDSTPTASSTNPVTSGGVASALSTRDTAISKCETLVVTVASFSSLPQTVSNSSIEDDMVVINSVLDTPASQTGDWTVTTSNGSLTISGSISGSTTLTLYLMKSR